VQNYLVDKASTYLSEELHTKVSVKSVDVRFFNKVLLEGVLVEDLKKDTVLYAGTLKGSVNDWFFMKDKISIENVGLDDVVVKLNRTDSVWNYQFIADYFSSPNKNNNKKKKKIAIDFKELHLTNIRFSSIDAWVGQDMIVNLGNMDVATDIVDLDNNKIHIKDIFLDKPYFAQNDYDGKRPENNGPKAQKPISTEKYKWNTASWNIAVDKLELKDGAFQNDKQSDEAPYTDRFDGQHLLFSKINGIIKNVAFTNDTISANIAIKGFEKSGLEIKKLESDFKLTPEIMEFKKLDLMTNRSRLRDYYAMRFEDFTPDFSRYIHNVTMDASFKESTINSDDLAIFAPALKSWKRILNIEGKAKGTLDNFNAKELKLKMGYTYVEGNLAMRGLPDITTTFIDFESKDLRTTYTEMADLFPQIKEIKKPALSKLGAVAFKGNFTGFINDFVAFGKFNTALGNIDADVNMKTPEGKPAKYSGSIATNGFKIGQFIDVNELGNVALNVKIDGTGFGLKDLQEKVNGTISAIDYNGYNYKNLIVNGDFEKKIFVGHASANDPNLKISSLDGTINFMEKTPGFKLVAKVEKADLKALGLVKENFNFNGDLDLNFTGNNIDNFLGDAKITNARLLQADNKLSFDYLTINSEMIGGQKSLSVHTNEMDANVTGNFKIQELPDAVKVLLAKYYPVYIKTPKYIVKSKQNFNFSLKTNNAEGYVKLLDKKLSGFNNAAVNGSFDLQNYDLKLNAIVPQFGYDGKTFTNITLNADGDRDTLRANMAIEDVMISDSFHLPNSQIQLTANNDLSMLKLNTSASKILGNTELNASIQTLSDGFKLHFFPSSFYVNNKKWELDKDGELTLRKNLLDASEVKFYHKDEAIVLKTELDIEGVTNDTHLVAELTNINGDDFAFLLPKNPSFKGKVTGKATLKDIFGKQTIDFEGYVDSFAFDGKKIGKVNIKNVNLNPKTGDIKYKGNIDEPDYIVDVEGSINIKDSTNSSLRNIITTKNLKLDILQPYLISVFSDVQGFAAGSFQLNQSNNKLNLIGDAMVSKGSLKVGYTQVRYNFDKQPLIFGDGFIELGSLDIKDTLGNKGKVSGRIYHRGFDNFSFEDVAFSTKKMLLLNTTKKDNAQFYGKVIGRANMRLNGGISNMKMDIDGEPSITDSSHVYLPTGDSKENNVIDYIDFVQFGSLMSDAAAKSSTNFVVELEIKANEACKVDVILDEETKDIITGQGNGLLKIKVGTKENLTINGNYELTKGEYTYNFQNFFKKPFVLKKGSTISWSGDPFLANMEIDAYYLAKNVDLSKLTSNSSLAGQSTRPKQEDINVLSHLSGTLKTPRVSFEFELPKESELNRDYLITKRLADFKTDENEMIKQVASLLVLNQFIDNNQAFLSGNSTISIATGTIGGAISSWLTGLLNNTLEKATKGKLSIGIDVNPTLNLQQANQQLQANIRSRLQYKISKNLQLFLGGSLDYNNPFASQSNRSNFTPDASLEWLVNKDGSIRVVGFYRSSFDFTTQQNRGGVRLDYRKDVTRIGDIFRSKKRIEYLDSLDATKPPIKRKKA
jgi:TamB, inner membrane protein subunit of TAM complex